MIGALGGPARRRAAEALLRRLLRRRRRGPTTRSRSRSARAARRATSPGSSTRCVPFIHARHGGAQEIVTAGISLGAFHAANFALKRADLFPLAHRPVGQLRPGDLERVGRARRVAAYFNNPLDYVAHMGGDHLDWLRSRLSILLVCGQGMWEDTTGSLESTKRLAGLLAEKGIRARARPVGPRRPARLAVLARPARPPSPEVLLMSATDAPDRPPARHRGGLAARLRDAAGADRADDDASGTTHRLTTERITIEPFDLRDKPRYDLVVDRLAWWYFVPREWLKKVALMDDVYLLNSPFTFQAMEKHAAYCAMLRLGLKVPRDRARPAQEPAGEHALRVHGGEVQPAVRPRGDRGADRLPAVHEALRRRPVGRRQPHQETRRAAPRLRRVRPAADAPAGVGRGLRRVRALAVDRRRDDGHELPPGPADARPLRGLRTTSSRPTIGDEVADDQPADQRVLPLGVQLLRDAHARRRRLPDRLRQRVARRRLTSCTTTSRGRSARC